MKVVMVPLIGIWWPIVGGRRLPTPCMHQTIPAEHLARDQLGKNLWVNWSDIHSILLLFSISDISASSSRIPSLLPKTEWQSLLTSWEHMDIILPSALMMPHLFRSASPMVMVSTLLLDAPVLELSQLIGLPTHTALNTTIPTTSWATSTLKWRV